MLEHFQPASIYISTYVRGRKTQLQVSSASAQAAVTAIRAGSIAPYVLDPLAAPEGAYLVTTQKSQAGKDKLVIVCDDPAVPVKVGKGEIAVWVGDIPLYVELTPAAVRTLAEVDTVPDGAPVQREIPAREEAEAATHRPPLRERGADEKIWSQRDYNRARGGIERASPGSRVRTDVLVPHDLGTLRFSVTTNAASKSLKTLPPMMRSCGPAGVSSMGSETITLGGAGLPAVDKYMCSPAMLDSFADATPVRDLSRFVRLAEEANAEGTLILLPRMGLAPTMVTVTSAAALPVIRRHALASSIDYPTYGHWIPTRRIMIIGRLPEQT